MKVDLETIKKLTPDVRKEFMKMYIRHGEKKKEHKIQNDFLNSKRAALL